MLASWSAQISILILIFLLISWSNLFFTILDLTRHSQMIGSSQYHKADTIWETWIGKLRFDLCAWLMKLNKGWMIAWIVKAISIKIEICPIPFVSYSIFASDNVFLITDNLSVVFLPALTQISLEIFWHLIKNVNWCKMSRKLRFIWQRTPISLGMQRNLNLEIVWRVMAIIHSVAFRRLRWIKKLIQRWGSILKANSKPKNLSGPAQLSKASKTTISIPQGPKRHWRYQVWTK